MNIEDPSIQKLTPMMQQWQACKAEAGSALLFFRMGDFYEAFFEDAVIIAKELDLTLTKRQDIPMSGIPWHASEGYIDKLVSKGYRIAIAEQTEDPKLAKGLVKREVVRVVTPGSLINSSLLSDKSNNFFASVARVGTLFGIAFLDLTTGEFYAIEVDNEQELLNEIYRMQPAELLFPEKWQDKQVPLLNELTKSNKIVLTPHDDWHFEHQVCCDFLTLHFKVHNLDGFGMRGKVASINAAGALLAHLKDDLCLNINHIAALGTYCTSQYMSIDRTTQRNLELIEPLHGFNQKNTLLSVLDRTLTPMGARLLRQWIKQPLLCTDSIMKRQEGVGEFFSAKTHCERLRTLLGQVSDLERLIMRVLSSCASPKDLVSLRASLEPIAEIRATLESLPDSNTLIQQELAKLNPLPELTQLLAHALVETPPFRLNEGGIFRTGYHSGLDELHSISTDSKTWIMHYQSKLREESGIRTLKVGFTRVFGYYIEVSKGQADKMPDTFKRLQTLANAERYITPELKEYENKVLHAEERSIALEAELFQQLRLEVAKYSQLVLNNANAIATLDCLQSLGFVAYENQYCRPIVDESLNLHIEEGRHPVIEILNVGEKFIPNDVLLDGENNRLALLTGPNMAGKSTYIRQVALLTIMAQIGSFLPAKAACIGIIDKVFTRIGASDDLARGQSTFMVEMTETAAILNNATDRSLVILDEIGRGTSTYDGISIAWAVAEHLLITEGKQAKTLFATHYWELTKLEERIPGAVNYTVAVHESDEEIRFLRKIVKGNSDKSYGIHVGRLAGLPSPVIGRAKEILLHLEENANRKSAFAPSKPKRASKPRVEVPSNEIQLTFFG